MLVRPCVAFATICLLSAAAYAARRCPDRSAIAHIAYTADQIDIEAGKQAIKISKNADVIAFAKDMIRDHEAVNKEALDLRQEAQGNA